FFFEDSNGEMVFAYPGSGWLMSKLPPLRAAPFPMTGRVQGLTMGFEIMPGFGPMFQLPASMVIPNTPRWDGVNRVIAPYWVESNPWEILMPEWLEKIGIGAANSDNRILQPFGLFLTGGSRNSYNAYGSALHDTMTFLASTGEYDLSGPNADSEFARMLDDADGKMAANIWLWRGMMQFVVPSAPRPSPLIEIGGDDTILISAALERLAELYEQDPLNAGARFIDEFGDLAFMLLEPKSANNALYVPRDEEGDNWVREHGD